MVALLVESKATIIDEIIDLHDRIIGRIFNQAKNRHRQVFHNAGKSINEKLSCTALLVKLLIQAKQQNVNPFDAIEHIISWEAFTQSVEDAQSLVQPNDFDFYQGFTIAIRPYVCMPLPCLICCHFTQPVVQRVYYKRLAYYEK